MQLRALSRGETSGTVLDCMNGGVPLIINAHGSMADLPDGTAWMLPDIFADAELVEAMETLERDADRRQAIAARAVDHVRRNHNPDEVAARYAEAIETFAARPRSSLARLGPALGRALASRNLAERDAAAANAALSLQPAFADRQILVDVSAIVRNDLRTGIERAARALIREMIAIATATASASNPSTRAARASSMRGASPPSSSAFAAGFWRTTRSTRGRRHLLHARSRA